MSNDLAELKRFVVAHAISQNLPPDHFGVVLDRIVRDDGDGPGSWAGEWIEAGDGFAARDEPLAAGQHYTLGRFPFVDGPGRERALRLAVAAFDTWRRRDTGITAEVVRGPGAESVKVWTAGLSAHRPRPLLVLTGGIVSTKEQWGAVLPEIERLGFAGVVAELPGVGENRTRYDRDSWRLFPAVLDAVADRADVAQTYLLALSFSGHLAITAALADPRIRGVVGNGPPLSAFFTDRAWQRGVPRITRDTFAHLVGAAPEAVFDHTADWALTEDALRALRIPVAVVTARRDEIIPPADTELLRRAVPDLTLLEHDDVHGAPAHLAETRLWSLLAVLDMRAAAGSANPAAHQALTSALAAARAGAAS
jgi:esterase FrsA